MARPYLEINGSERTKHSSPSVHRWQYTGFVDTVHYITDDVPNDNCNKHQIVFPGEKECGGWVNARTFEYTEEAILKYVNSLGASFDTIKVVPDLGGYRVFPEKRSCNGPDGYYYGDEFLYAPEMVARKEAVYQHYYELEKEEMGRVNFSLWVDEFDPGALHLVRHSPGTFQTAHNTHWIIRVDKGDNLEDRIATAKETHLGKYAC